ncbi:MAG: glycosyltransferase family 39 protein [Acidobacteria bacterium]|nr:glycosyltransferase family 39 protein [Acidobacteriota bacterium]
MRRGGLLLVLVCLLTFVFALGRSAITDSDEAYYAEAAREMVVSGDWTTPHYNFEPRLQKPVLFYWLIASTYAVAGVDELNARVWSALAGTGLALVAAAIGRRWFGRAEGLVAGAIVATGFGVAPFARQSLPDMPLAFFVTVSIWAAFEALSPAEVVPRTPDRRHGHGWLFVAAAAAALGMLDKGPVAIALPVTVLAPWLAWRARRGDRRWPDALRPVPLATAAGVFLLIAAPWYLAVMHAQGLDYARQFFIGENVDRFATSTYNQWRGWMYVPVIIAGLLPWSAYFVLWRPALADALAGRRRTTPVEMRLISWTLGPLAFFMLSVGSQPRYILPCLVPLSILLGRSIWSRATAAETRRLDAFRLSSVLATLMMLAVSALLWRAAAIFARAGADVTTAGPVAMTLLSAVAVVGACVAARRRLPLVVGGAAALALGVFAGTLLSPPRPEPAEIVGAILRTAPRDVQVCSCGAFARTLTLYAERPVVIADVTPADPGQLLEVLDSPGRSIAVVDARTLAVVEREGRRFPRLADVTYLNLGVWQRGETLLRPDPAWVQRVIVIANR